MNQFYYVDIIFRLLLVILFSANFVVSQGNTGSCTTPDSKPGICVNIIKCRSLLSILQNNRNPSSPQFNFLQRSHCGFEGKNPVVCCSLENFQSLNPSFQPTLQLPIQSRPVDVSKDPAVAEFLPAQCGFFTEEKITGGTDAGLFEFPWMALLGYNTKNGIQYGCGGSLINARYVLTAAHCIKTSNKLSLAQVRLGEHSIKSKLDCQINAGCAPPVQDFLVEEAIVHPNYEKSVFSNDVGLIRLNRNAIFTDSVSPICLPIGKTQQERSLDDENVVVTGWGTTDTGFGSDVLQKVKIKVMSLEKCAKIYSKSLSNLPSPTARITEKQICAGGIDNRDSCIGDSGGPLQKLGQTTSGGFSYIQYGLVSFGPFPCGQSNAPGVYTRVGYYMNWILKNLRH